MREYRDYYAGKDSYPYTDGWTPVVLALVVANVLAYIAMHVLVKARVAAAPEILDWAAFVPHRFAHGGRWWQVVTYAFLHDLQNPFHLLVNMYMLWLGGRDLEFMYGKLRFLRFYLIAAAVGALAYLASALASGGEDAHVPMLGASGAVMAVLVVYAFYHPGDRLLLFFMIEVPMGIGVLFLVALDLFMTFKLAPSHGIATACHLGGAAFGLVYYKLGNRVEAMVERDRSAPDERPAPRIALRPAKTLEDELDAVLKKVHEGGMASLTPDELSILERASKHYREQKK